MRGQHYDLVLNGVEIGGGSVRIHDAAMQEYVFKKILEVRRLDQHVLPLLITLHFSLTSERRLRLAIYYMLCAVEHLPTAASPSVSRVRQTTGCSLIRRSAGFDRLIAILCKTESIRDVIAFPKTGTGTDLLFKSPAKVSKGTMAQYGIQPI